MTRAFCAIAAALLFALAACGPATPPEVAPGSPVIAFTNDAGGELSDCACSKDAAGGIARRVAYLQRLKREQGANVLAIEAGGVLFPFAPKTKRERLAETARARLTAAAYRRAGYDVVVFGRGDYALGLPVLREVEKDAGAIVLGANVRRRGEEKALWAETVIVRRAGLQIGVIGLLEASDPPPWWPGQIEILDPITVAASLGPGLRKLTDVVVLAGDLNRKTLARLIGEVPGIDFVLKSGEAKVLRSRPEIMTGAKTPVFCLYEGGRDVGRLDLRLVARGQPIIDSAEHRSLELKIAKYREYVAAIQKAAGDPDKVADYLAGRPDTLARYRRYRENLEEWNEALARLQQTSNRFTYRLVELSPGIGEDAATAAAVAEFEKQNGTVAQMRRRRDPNR